MRAPSHSADRISACAILLGGTGGMLVSVVALPLALSNPFPTPRDGAWIIENPVFNARSAIVSPNDAAQSDAQTDRPLVMAALEAPGDQSLTFAERWNLRAPQAAVAETDPDKAAPVEVFIDASPEGANPEPAPHAAPEAESAPERKPHHRPAVRAEAAPPLPSPAPPKRTAASLQDSVDQYLWDVYQRRPVKSDSTGDFTWKDQAAAKRLGISVKSYVIGGMDPDFREQLYHAGHAMDANGLHWSMLSAFRDDYRQGLAAGFKAHGGNSQHGGSRATGGYGHGRAIDITSAEGEGDAIWHWIDTHGTKYGLVRPMTRIDPAHIQARSSFHDLAHELREARVRLEDKLGTKTKVATK